MKNKILFLILAAAITATGCSRSSDEAKTEGATAPSAMETATASAATETSSAAPAGKGFFSFLKVPQAAAQSARPAPAPLDPSKIDTAKLIRTLRGEQELPEEVSLRIENIRPTSVPGLAAGDIVLAARGQEQKETIFFSTDGKWLASSSFHEPLKLEPAPIPGFNILHIRDAGSGEEKPLYISEDGSLVTFGEFWDTSVDPNMARMKKLTLNDSPVRGRKGSKVVLVEFSDFQCPYCDRAYQLISSRIYPEYKDKVEFRFKQLPLSFHDWARPAANAALCAADQDDDKFWKAYGYFFENQRSIKKANIDEKIKDMAGSAGLKMRDFLACVDERRFDKQVERDIQEANGLGITGTPAFMINGRKISGAQPYDAFKRILDEELASAN